MSEFRVIIVGLGVQGRKRQLVAGKDVIAIVDPVHPDATHKSVEDVSPAEYDAALICVPDAAKIDLIERLARMGKSILVEKPLVSQDESEIRRLAETIKASGSAYYTAYNHRFEPHIVRLRDVIRSGELGELYSLRMFYGNGTARLVRESPWRDRGAGVLTDLGSHLLDTLQFLLGDVDRDFALWAANRCENKSFDHVVFGAHGKPLIELEMTLLSWRNDFRADLLAERGSAHISSLCKWGPSTFTCRRRVLPSGRPEEENDTLTQNDPTWELEYEHFKTLCRTGGSNIEQDIWINRTLARLAAASETAQ